MHMEILHAGIITLLRCALTGEKLRLPEFFSLDEAYNILYNHHLLGLGIQGASLCGIPRTDPAMVKMTATFCGDLKKSRGQMQKIQEVYSVFDANRIEYLPVKGAVIKPLYPRPEYRVMGDADILIREEQYPLIRSILPTVGLLEKDNSDYEYTWECPELTLELHRHLMSPRYKNYYEYYNDSWRLAQKEGGSCKYLLSPEEHFIYLIVHFAKHYLNGSICAKDICDFYVWRNAHPMMDEDYIVERLQTLKLTSFYRNLLDLLDNWFGGADATETTEKITASVFRGGVYEEFSESVVVGLMHRYTDEKDSITKKKITWFTHAVFPSCKTLSYAYPVLKRLPFLLPIFWAVRWFDALFRNKQRIKRGVRVMKMDNNNTQKYDAHIKMVGLESDED